MNFDFAKIFGKPASRPPVKIRTKRAMRLMVDGEDSARHVDPGETVSIPHDILRQLDASDYTLLDGGPQPDVQDPTPAAPAPRPLPQGWERLPECFAEYHELAEKFRCASEHVEAIIAKRREVFGTDLRNFQDADGTLLAMRPEPASQRGPSGIFLNSREIDLSDPVNRKIDRFLTIAESAARDHLQRLREDFGIRLERLHLECGGQYLAAVEAAASTAAEIAETGLAIFKARLEPLGLHDAKLRALFVGSRDHARYASAPAPMPSGVRSAGYDDNGCLRRYCDQPVISLATMTRNVLDGEAARAALLDEARAELRKTRKAAA